MLRVFNYISIFSNFFTVIRLATQRRALH